MCEMEKHYFANGITCGQCGLVVDVVEAFSWELASAGQGLCADCVAANALPAPDAPADGVATDDAPTPTKTRKGAAQ
jgi:hypothetical protein